MDNYTTYIGTRRAKKPAQDLYSIYHREARDDGKTILWIGDMLPVCADCGTGHLQWAEGGYVPWHRICDVCGSHWDLHPVTWGPARPREPIPAQAARSEILLCDECSPPSKAACVECREHGKHILSPARSATPAIEVVRWVDGRGEVPIDPSEPITAECPYTWGDVLVAVRPEHWTAAEQPDAVMQVGMVVVSFCWARRARFY